MAELQTSLHFMDKHVINWIEQVYHESSVFPSIQVMKDAWPTTFPNLSTVRDWLAKPVVKQALHNRGLAPRKVDSATNELSEQQAAAILTVANLSDRRSQSTKLKSIGVTLTQWNAWKKQPSFKNFLYKCLNEDLDSSLDRAFSGLLKGVDNGDTRAIQFYMELTGRQPTENERNFKLAVSRIIESITRHVKDPELLKKIANDFELIEQGRDPSALIQLAPSLSKQNLTALDQIDTLSQGI